MNTEANPTLVLVERAHEGDDDAYERLFATAHDRLQLYIRLRLGRALRSKLESDDVLQDTFLAAHGAFGDFRWSGPHSFGRWLCRIAENRIRGLADHHGAAKRAPAGGFARMTGLVERLGGTATGPATHAARDDDIRRLASALDGVDDAQREVLMLRFFAGMHLDEIAALTGSSRSSVRRRLGKAARNLGMALGGAA